jgi:tripartite-type tricarboxylate transporter receptor subunit TctC
MRQSRRTVLRTAASVAALPLLGSAGRAQSYPSRPLRIVVGVAAGSPQDILSRLVGQWLSERLGQPVIVENRPGAATNLATEAVVRAPADGYTRCRWRRHRQSTNFYSQLQCDARSVPVAAWCIRRKWKINPVMLAKIPVHRHNKAN